MIVLMTAILIAGIFCSYDLPRQNSLDHRPARYFLSVSRAHDLAHGRVASSTSTSFGAIRRHRRSLPGVIDKVKGSIATSPQPEQPERHRANRSS